MKFYSILVIAALAGVQAASCATLIVNVADNSTLRSTVGNQGTSAELQVGDTTTAGDYIRSALAFDLTDPLLNGATINSVTLTLTVASADTGTPGSQNVNMTVNLHELTSSFTTSGVTWTSRDGTNNWTTAGGDFGATVLASITGNPRTASGTTFDFTGVNLTSAADNAIGGTFYLLAKSSVEDTSARNLFRFASSRNTTVSYRPTLSIDYTPIPEPTSALLGGIGMLALLRRRRC